MRTWRKLALLPSLFGTTLLIPNDNISDAQTQSKRIRIVDTILYGVDSLKNAAGIQNLYVTFNGKNYTTNSEGYVDINEGVTDVDDGKSLENRDILNIRLLNGNNLVFQYNGVGTLRIYNILGQQLRSYVNYENNVSWNLTDESNFRLPSGNYFYLIEYNRRITTGKVALLQSSFGPLAILGGESLNKQNSDQIYKSSVNNSRSLESIVENFTIKDELLASADSVNNLGNYFDIATYYSSLDEVPNTIHVIPVLQFDSKYYRNILHFAKYITFSDGTNGVDILLRWYKKDQPIKVFPNSATAPNQNYIAAVDSAINSWENMTAFTYKNYNLSPLDLFTKVSAQPDTGVAMDYTQTSSGIDWKWYGPTAGLARGPPYFATVHVSNSISTGLVYVQTKHELGGHILFSSSRHSSDPNHNIQSGQYVTLDEGKTVRIIYCLEDLQDMRIYKED